MTLVAQASQVQNASVAERVCDYCKEPIHLEALKCRYCGEMLNKRPPSKLRRILKDAIKYVGLLTVLLSLSYTLREGYYFIKVNQEKRTAIESHKAAAVHFEKLNNLDYAVKALEQALVVKPTDLTLQRQHFLLRAHSVLREVEDWGAQAYTDDARHTISALTLDGFRLLHFPLPKSQRARLLIMLGRLLPQDAEWNDDARITALFEEAYQLMPQDAEVAFRYGYWSLDQQPKKGFELLMKATQLQPDNAFYWSELGNHKLKNRDYRDAMFALQTAIRLFPKQTKLQHIRAANSAKRLLRDLLLQAHKDQNITSPDFFGLDMTERETLLKEALAHNASDMKLNFLAAQFYHAIGNDEQAVRTVKTSLFNRDLSKVAIYERQKLELYAAILEKTGQTPATLARLRDMLEQSEEARLYDKVLEIGHKDQRRYKVGLKVHAKASKEGVLVDIAHKHYPFATAGVQKGDKIFEFAHRKIETLRDIWIPLIDFDPGTQLPLKVKRGTKIMELTLVVE